MKNCRRVHVAIYPFFVDKLTIRIRVSLAAAGEIKQNRSGARSSASLRPQSRTGFIAAKPSLSFFHVIPLPALRVDKTVRPFHSAVIVRKNGAEKVFSSPVGSQFAVCKNRMAVGGGTILRSCDAVHLSPENSACKERSKSGRKSKLLFYNKHLNFLFRLLNENLLISRTSSISSMKTISWGPVLKGIAPRIAGGLNRHNFLSSRRKGYLCQANPHTVHIELSRAYPQKRKL